MQRLEQPIFIYISAISWLFIPASDDATIKSRSRIERSAPGLRFPEIIVPKALILVELLGVDIEVSLDASCCFLYANRLLSEYCIACLGRFVCLFSSLLKSVV